MTRCRSVFRTLIGDYRCDRDHGHPRPHQSVDGYGRSATVKWTWPMKRHLSLANRRGIGAGVRRSHIRVELPA